MSMFWLRESVLEYGGRAFKYPDYEIQFRVEFSKGGDPDMGVIDLYNLAPLSKSLFEVVPIEDSSTAPEYGSWGSSGHASRDPPPSGPESVTLRAGYQGDTGIVMCGLIRNVREIFEGVDHITEIEVHDTSDEYQGVMVSESYVPGTTGSEILERLISMSGLERGDIQLVADPVYVEGRNVDGVIKDAIGQIVKDCESEVHITHGSIYILPPGGMHDEVIILSPESGLLGSPKRNEDAESNTLWEVESLLNYRIRAGSLVQIESKRVSGTFAVESGEHISDGSEFKTVIQLVEPGGA